MTRSKPPPISFDFSGAFLPSGITAANVASLVRKSHDAMSDVTHFNPAETWLEGYQRDRTGSGLARILGAAKRLRDEVDRVVVVGQGQALYAVSSMFAACCDPHFNELTRGERGGRPRIYFCDADFDNDALRGLMYLLGENRSPAADPSRWAVVVIDSIQLTGNDEHSAVRRQYAGPLLDLLARSPGPGASTTNIRTIIADEQEGCLMIDGERISAAPLEDVSTPRSEISRGFTVSEVFPCAVMGLDVVQWLEGASAMTERCRREPLDNPALSAAAIHHFLRRRSPHLPMALATWARALAPLAAWRRYQSNAASHLQSGEAGRSIISVSLADLTAIEPENHPLGWIAHHLVVDAGRTEPLLVEPSDPTDRVWRRDKATLPRIVENRRSQVLQAYRSLDRPLMICKLPLANEASIGQWMQWAMLSTALEAQMQRRKTED